MTLTTKMSMKPVVEVLDYVPSIDSYLPGCSRQHVAGVAIESAMAIRRLVTSETNVSNAYNGGFPAFVHQLCQIQMQIRDIAL